MRILILFSLSSSSLLLLPSFSSSHLSCCSKPGYSVDSAVVNLGTVLTLLAHAMFAFLGNSSFIALLAMIIMGVAYSLLAYAL